MIGAIYVNIIQPGYLYIGNTGINIASLYQLQEKPASYIEHLKVQT